MNLETMTERAAEAEGVLKVLANKYRLLIVCNLIDKEYSVSELNKLFPLAQSAFSQHLAVLRNANILNTRREAQTIYYSIADDRVARLVKTMYVEFCGE